MAFGVILITVIGLLAIAALGSHYRSVGRAGTAGCIGIAALDSTMLVAVPLLAVAASVVRISFTARTLRPVPTG
jgi:hypothetical protein